MEKLSAPLTERFSKLKDPRVDRSKRHKLIDMGGHSHMRGDRRSGYLGGH